MSGGAHATDPWWPVPCPPVGGGVDLRVGGRCPVREWHEIRAECVVSETETTLALNKPAGLSVMGERHDTDVVTLAQEAGERLYPVHRIDKVTSGTVLFAKDLGVHGELTRQFNRRTVDKVYLALTRSSGLPDAGTIDLPLVTASSGRVRVAAAREAITQVEDRWTVPTTEIFTHTRTYPSTTTFATVWTDGDHTLLAVRPVTGRRHQIRVHLAWIGHPIDGDPLFDKAAVARGDRTCLHSWRLAYDPPGRVGDRVHLQSEPGPDFWTPVAASLPAGGAAEVLAEADRLAATRLRQQRSGEDRPG